MYFLFVSFCEKVGNKIYYSFYNETLGLMATTLFHLKYFFFAVPKKYLGNLELHTS